MRVKRLLNVLLAGAVSALSHQSRNPKLNKKPRKLNHKKIYKLMKSIKIKKLTHISQMKAVMKMNFSIITR